MRFMATVFSAFFARQNPVSIMAKPMCMNITTIAAKSSQTTPLEGMDDAGIAAAAGSAASSQWQLKMQAAAVPAEINRRFQRIIHRHDRDFSQQNPGMARKWAAVNCPSG